MDWIPPQSWWSRLDERRNVSRENILSPTSCCDQCHLEEQEPSQTQKPKHIEMFDNLTKIYTLLIWINNPYSLKLQEAKLFQITKVVYKSSGATYWQILLFLSTFLVVKCTSICLEIDNGLQYTVFELYKIGSTRVTLSLSNIKWEIPVFLLR